VLGQHALLANLPVDEPEQSVAVEHVLSEVSVRMVRAGTSKSFMGRYL
jgi:hypothetical protein